MFMIYLSMRPKYEDAHWMFNLKMETRKTTQNNTRTP